MADELLTDLSVTAEIQLYYDLFVPESLSAPAPMLIAVHGYGAHKRYMMREARSIAPDGWVIASLQAPHPHYRRTDSGYRIGFGWTSDHRPEQHIQLHHEFIFDVIERLVEEGTVDVSQIYLYGFSQACALNFRFALTFPETLRGLVGVCGGVPGDLAENVLYSPTQAKTLYLYGDDDEFYTQEQFASFDEQLRAILPNYRSRKYTARHEITDEMRSDMRDWLLLMA
jgi:predicted esterase